MTSYAGPWSPAPGIMPLFHQEVNRVGAVPLSVGGQLGPVWDGSKQVRPYLPEEGWRDFFGKPRKAYERPVSDDLEHSMLDLPDAYKGSVPYLSQILINKITSDKTWILNKFAPWIKYESGMEVSWDIWTFQDHLLTRTPEEAVSRLLTHKSSSESTSMVRYGIALMLEHGFFNTVKGRKNYQMNIHQIQNAIVETACFGAMHAAYNAEVYTDDYEAYRVKESRTRNGIDAFFQPELDSWGIFQKSEDGFVNMASQMKDALDQRAGGVRPDMICLPLGARKYMKNITMGQPYAMSGLKPGESIDMIPDSYLGCSVYESRYFRQGEHRPAIDPAYRTATIGNFFQGTNRGTQGVSPEHFKMHMLDSVIFNEDTDEMEKFSFVDNFRYCGLFDNFGKTDFPPLSYDLGQKYFAGFSNWYDFMKQTLKRTSTLDYIVKGIASKPYNVQAKFAFAMLGKENSSRGETLSGPARTPTQSALGGKMMMNRGRMWTSGADIMEKVQLKFQIDRNELQQIKRLVDRCERLDQQQHHEDDSSLLMKLKEILEDLSPSSTDIYSTLQMGIAGSLLKVDLNESANSIISGVAGVRPTPVEQMFGRQREARWPESIPSEFRNADGPVWRSAGDDMQVPTAVYTGLTATKTLPLPSQIFTLTSTHATLIRLPGNVLDHIKHKKGLIQVVGSSDDARTGFLEYSVAISCLFEIFKKHERSYNSASNNANRKAILDALYMEVEGISSGWEMYPEQMQQGRYLEILESQHDLGAIIYGLKMLVAAALQHQLSSSTCTEAFMTFLQNYSSFFGHNNPSYLQTQSSVAGRLITPHTHKTKAILEEKKADENTYFNDAVAATDELKSQLVKEEKKGGDLPADSFIAFHDSYVQLYQVWMVRGWSREGWVKFVSGCQKLYSKEAGSIASSRQIRGILDFLFTKAVDSDAEPANVEQKDIDLNINTENAKFEELKKNESRLAYHRLFNVSKDSDVDDTKTHARELRKGAWDSGNDSKELTPLDRFIVKCKPVINNNLTGYLNTTQAITDAQALGITFDPRETALLNLLCLSNTVSAQASTKLNNFALADKGKGVAHNLQVRLKTSNLDQVFKQIRARWGLVDVYTDADKKADEKVAASIARGYTDAEIVALLKVGKINGAFITFCLENDVLPPLGFRGYLPHMTYVAGSAFMAEGGGKCASTLFGHSDFQLADDAARKIHYGHYTMYNKTVLWSRAHIVHARNVFIKSYKGGAGTLVQDPLDPYDVEAYHRGELARDIFLIPHAIDLITNQKHCDFSGTYHKTLSASRVCEEESNLWRMEYWTRLWRVKRNQRNPLDTSFFAESSPRTNTMCWQAHQQVWCQGTKDYSDVILNKGHWGPDVYSGCGKTRKGGTGTKVLSKTNYLKQFMQTQLVK